MVIAKGKAMVEWAPSADNRADILNAAMGRSGGLRAPTVRLGNTLVIGYNDAVYAQFFSGGSSGEKIFDASPVLNV